jgi:hypothetical protein
MVESSTPSADDRQSSTDPAVLRHTRLIGRVRRDPKQVLRDRRCLKPAFCEAFLELCDGVALQQPKEAVRYARVAVELAGKIGDPHLSHRAHGVLVHAYIARKERDEARQLLEDYRLSALSCCKQCTSDWLMRSADLAAESADGRGAREMVERSRRELGERLDPDTDARLSFIEGIGCLFEADRDAALDKVGATLRDLDLSSPRGYYLDSVAFIAWYLRGGAGPGHFAFAREILDGLRERLTGLRGWGDLRARKSWVEGLVLGRLGDWKPALERLESGRQALLKSGPPRHAVAISVDVCQAHARWINDVSLRSIQRTLGICRNLKGLDATMRKQLKHLKTAVSWQPQEAARKLASFRESFIVTVPGLLGEPVFPFLMARERPSLEGEG